jgi:PAS domain S-box-containing protein
MKKKPAAPPGAAELHRNPRPLLRAALIVAAYLFAFIILDFITKQFAELPGVVAWYPPAGLTYSLLLVFGVSFAPAVTIALLISSLFIYRMPQPPYLLFLWALIISLIYSLAAAFLRNRIRFDWQLRKLRDVTWLVVTTALVSALLAVLSVSSSALSSDLPRSEVLRAIFLWWIGEMVGVLTVTPFLLIHVMPWLKRFAEGQPVKLRARLSFPRPTLSVIGQASSLAFMFYWVFGTRVLGEFRPMYLISLPLIWIALHHGLRGVTAGIVALNFGMVFALLFFRFDLAGLGELQLLMIVNCIVGLLMGAVITERKRAEQELAIQARIASIFGTLSNEEMFNEVLKVILDLMHSPFGVFGYLDQNGDWVVPTMTRQIWDKCQVSEKTIRFPRETWGDSSWPRALREKRTIYSNEPSTNIPEGHVSIQRHISMPILFQGEAIGLFQVANKETDYTEEDIRKLADIAETVAPLLSARLRREQAEKTLRESEDRYRDLVENSLDLICTHDLEGKLLSVNPAAVRLCGYSEDELLGMNLRDVLAPEVRKQFKAYLAEIQAKGSASGMLLIQTKSGEKRIWEYNNTLRTEGAAESIVRGMAQDVTERKQAESQLHEKIAELQRWHNVTLGRESRILDLKREVNKLLGKAGQPPRYLSAEAQGNKEK